MLIFFVIENIPGQIRNILFVWFVFNSIWFPRNCQVCFLMKIIRSYWVIISFAKIFSRILKYLIRTSSLILGLLSPRIIWNTELVSFVKGLYSFFQNQYERQFLRHQLWRVAEFLAISPKCRPGGHNACLATQHGENFINKICIELLAFVVPSNIKAY